MTVELRSSNKRERTMKGILRTAHAPFRFLFIFLLSLFFNRWAFGILAFDLIRILCVITGRHISWHKLTELSLDLSNWLISCNNLFLFNFLHSQVLSFIFYSTISLCRFWRSRVCITNYQYLFLRLLSRLMEANICGCKRRRKLIGSLQTVDRQMVCVYLSIRSGFDWEAVLQKNRSDQISSWIHHPFSLCISDILKIKRTFLCVFYSFLFTYLSFYANFLFFRICKFSFISQISNLNTKDCLLIGLF